MRLACLLCLVAAALAQEPAAMFADRGGTLALAPTGTFDVRYGAENVLTRGRIALWGPDWKGTDQGAMADAKVTLDGAARVVTGTLQEPVSGGLWSLRQTVSPDPAGVRVRYELRPQAAMSVNEVSWLGDLPVTRWQGRTLRLYRAAELAFPVEPPQNKHFVAAAATRYVFDADAPGQLTIGLDRPRLCNVQDTRGGGGQVYQPFVKIIEGVTQVKPGDVFELTMVITMNDPARYPTALFKLDSDRPLRLGATRCEPAAPQAGRLVRLRVDLQGRWRTPFRSSEVALDAVITGAGRTWRVPGCYTADFDRQVTGGREALEPRGEPGWEVRFLPPVAGAYQVHLTARDASGEVSGDLAFTAGPGEARPYVRVAQADPHYFEFTDGRPYFANGLNVCWARREVGTPDYDRWFARLGEQGGNFARLWMPSWGTGFEWGKPGSYKLDRAWQMDHLVALAEQHGIYLKVCLENFRTFEGENPYWRGNGGPCDQVLDLFTNPAAKAMWRDRLRYAVARWGWSPNVLAWEYWNEIDCVQGYQAPVVQAWTVEMSRYLREVDPFDHLIVNSLGSFVYEPELWSLPEMDFAQMHGYWHPTWRSKEFGKDLAGTMEQHVPLIRKFGKPCFFAEFGLVNETWGPSPRMADDPDGVNLHTGMWGAMMSGAAGVGHLWWWDNYVDPTNQWPRFGAAARFVADVPWNTAKFEPFTAAASDGVRALGLRSPDLTLVWARNLAWTWWNVAEKLPIPPVRAARVTLPDLRGRFNVERWDPYAGQVLNTTELTAGDGGLVLEVGDLPRDVAFKVRPRR